MLCCFGNSVEKSFFTMKTSKRFNPFTRTATAASSVYTRVLWRVLVSVRAMRDGLLDFARSFYCGGVAEAAPQVFLQRDSLQVIWVDAGAYPAKMVNLHSWWNRAAKQFIRNAVRQAGFSADGKLAVSRFEASEPQPASRVRLRGNLFHKSLQRISCWLGHAAILTADSAYVMGRKYGYA